MARGSSAGWSVRAGPQHRPRQFLSPPWPGPRPLLRLNHVSPRLYGPNTPAKCPAAQAPLEASVLVNIEASSPSPFLVTTGAAGGAGGAQA